MADVFVSSRTLTIPYSSVPIEVTKDKIVTSYPFSITHTASPIEEYPTWEEQQEDQGTVDLIKYLPWVMVAIAAVIAFLPGGKKKTTSKKKK